MEITKAIQVINEVINSFKGTPAEHKIIQQAIETITTAALNNQPKVKDAKEKA